MPRPARKGAAPARRPAERAPAGVTEIVYERVPGELRAALREHVERWRWILPDWYRTLTVYYERKPDADDAGESTLACEPLPHYRCANLYVYPGWIDQAPPDRARDVAHEFAHVLLAPLAAEAERMLETYLPAGKARDWALRVLRDAEEGVTCDVEHAATRGATPRRVSP